MSTIEARLNRLMPALTARERGILVLRALKDGVEENRDWRDTMPSDQTGDFNHLIGLMNACNIQLAAVLIVIERTIDTLEAKALWAGTLALMAEEVGRKMGRPRSEPRVIDVLPERLQTAVVTQAATTWQELRAIEIVTEEIAEEFGGEQPLRPAHADSLTQSKERLVGLQELVRDFEMSDPTAEDLEELRKAIKKWAK